MSYQVLARKWRPRKFQDVIGQEAITRSLQNAIKRSRLGHAYLFTGTRGIGKTSVARLFAQAIRCESLTPDGNPCGICMACQDMAVQNSMNVIEIDGASNNGVDEIRELISNVQYLPTNGSYKVYIIDEVHMLSKPAFNALLKTLEEPPKHVIFLLATTEPNKLLGTVLSRCQRFDFVNASIDSLATHLITISKAEGITFENEMIVRDIARLGNGSFRDTLSLLDQVLSYTSDNVVTEEILAKSLGVVRRQILDQITANVLIGDAQAASDLCKQTLNENIALKSLVSALLENIFDAIEHIDDEAWLERHPNIQNAVESVTIAELLWVYESLARETSWLFEAIGQEQVFLVLLKKLALRRQILGLEQSEQIAKKKVVKAPAPVEPVEVKKTEPELKPEPIPESKPEPDPVVQTAFGVSDFLTYLEKHAAALAASLEHAEITPAQLENASELLVRYPADGHVFYDVIAEDSSRMRIEQHLHKFLGRKVDLVIEMVQANKTDVKTRAQVRQEQDALNDEGRRNEIMSDPMLQMAQELFNAKIDKIQLGKKED